MKITAKITAALQSLSSMERAVHAQRYFKTGPGEYAEGDVFWGISVPKQRAIAKEFYRDCTPSEAFELLKSQVHEVRLTALFILVALFEKSDDVGKKEIYEGYLAHTEYVNNWDLVDSSAHKIVGAYLLLKEDSSVLLELANSDLLWENRIAMVSTLAFIKKHQLDEVYLLAEEFLSHTHDLMHKATGWMLREAGKIHELRLISFIETHAARMPRTMLRYAIERLPRPERTRLMQIR